MSSSKMVSCDNSGLKCTNKKHDAFLKFKYLKELSNVKTQLDLNTELNKKAANILNNSKGLAPNANAKKENLTLSKKQQEIFNLNRSVNRKRVDIINVNNNISKINNDLISYVKLRQNYMQHDNYWKQSWVFTDNPVYEYENHQGFDNPAYLFGLEEKNISRLKKKSNKDFTRAYQISYLNNLINTFETNRKEQQHQEIFCNSSICSSSSSEVMNIYEDILDLNQNCKQVLSTSSSSIISSSSLVLENKNNQENKIVRESYKNSEFEISSPESNDSGIHSDDRLNRHISSMDIMDSLYSSVTSSCKKNCSETKEDETNLESNEETDSDSQIVHVEQHALPMGWIRCCDDTGIYYWHKPSGTVTRKPPNLISSPLNSTTLTPPEKNFSIKEFVNSELFKKFTESVSSSEVSSNSSPTNRVSQKYDEENKPNIDNTSHANVKIENISSKMCASDFSSSSASSSMSSSYCSAQHLENKIKNNPNAESICIDNSKVTRFYVRSLGWVKIDESDLTPERSSKAVNKCINDLSRGIKDINDVVARWGQGKDLYMDLQDNILLLIDPVDDKILNKQAITSIRVWGVGRDNGRCDSAPAKEIANSLRDICKSILNEKKQITQSPASRASSNLLRRPNFLPDLTVNNNLNVNKRKQTVNTPVEIRDTSNFIPKPMDEPKKTIRCRYLGSTQVLKPSGIDVLNAGIEKIYAMSLDEYRRMKRQQIKKLKNNNRNDDFNENKNRLDTDEEEDLDDYDFDLDQNTTISFDNILDLNTEKNLGIECDVVISPSKIEVNQSSDCPVLECRTRYLSFMGISNDVRLCGIIMHCIDNTFKCHAFLCENSSGSLCKTIEAACKLRYQKCLDAHPETQSNTTETIKQNQPKLGYLGSQLKNMFDSLKYRNLFSNISKSNK